MIDSTNSEGHRIATSVLKMSLRRCIGRTYGRISSEVHVVIDGDSKPLATLLTEGQTSDDKGREIDVYARPRASAEIADRSYYSEWRTCTQWRFDCDSG